MPSSGLCSFAYSSLSTCWRSSLLSIARCRLAVGGSYDARPLHITCEKKVDNPALVLVAEHVFCGHGPMPAAEAYQTEPGGKLQSRVAVRRVRATAQLFCREAGEGQRLLKRLRADKSRNAVGESPWKAAALPKQALQPLDVFWIKDKGGKGKGAGAPAAPGAPAPAPTAPEAASKRQESDEAPSDAAAPTDDEKKGHKGHKGGKGGKGKGEGAPGAPGAGAPGAGAPGAPGAGYPTGPEAPAAPTKRDEPTDAADAADDAEHKGKGDGKKHHKHHKGGKGKGEGEPQAPPQGPQ